MIRGKAIKFGKNIDTDQIIGAHHLNLPTIGDMAPFAFENAPHFVEDFKRGDIIVGEDNFGCGSSREHAAVCLQIAGIEAVVAESYARIFYRNVVDGGFFVPFEATMSLNTEIATGDELEINVNLGTLKNLANRKQYGLKPLGDIIEILRAGDVFEYARKKGLIKR